MIDLDTELAAAKLINQLRDALGAVFVERDTARVELKEAVEALRDVMVFIDFRVPEPPDHTCGDPNAVCSGECVDYARWVEVKRSARAVQTKHEDLLK